MTILESSTYASRGGRLYNVAAGTPIYAGEPVQIRAVGGIVVEPCLDNTPVVEASAGVGGLFVGVATTNSTNTTSAAGTVNIMPANSDITYLISPDVAGDWNTQSEYDALVGKRVLLNNSVTVSSTPTSGTYTLLSSDSATNGVIVQAMNVLEHPGKVAIAFRKATSSLN